MRKLTYLGLIGGLFFLTLGLRLYIIEPKARALEVREEDLGDVELTGSAIRLTLTGSRGIAVCALWVVADNMKKKHEWNKLELAVNSIIKLQPHFIEPWFFQSWNLAYNVSVEADHPRDKYFYITRGIEMLCEGERRNKEIPDIRKEIGFYYQNKLGISDENNYFRCLFQMSCMDPLDRDVAFLKLMKSVEGRQEVDMEKFREFCEKHPFFVRRLRDRLGKDEPYKVVEFLEENKRIPSLFDEGAMRPNMTQTPKKPIGKGFPVLPSRSQYDPTEITNETSQFDDSFDNFVCSRAWMTYAQDPYENPNLKRVPRKPALLIFLGFPARAQAYYADRLQKEGWFDEDGWTITDWFPEPVKVGTNRYWSGNAWDKAFAMYQSHGTRHGLYKTVEEQSSLTDQERADYEYGNRLTNFSHFYYQCEVERAREAVTARKFFFLADRARTTPRKAIELYRNPAAFGPPSTWFSANPSARGWQQGWKKVLAEHDNFRHDSSVQEESYEYQVKYLDLERQLSEGLNEQLKWLAAIQASSPAGTNAASALVPLAMLAGDVGVPIANAKGAFRGPLDDVAHDGQPYISPVAEQTVNQRLKTLGGRRTPTK
jgi:hypothetical protein